MKLFDTLGDFLREKYEMKYMLTIDDKAFVTYLADFFKKLNILNNQLQGAKKL